MALRRLVMVGVMLMVLLFGAVSCPPLWRRYPTIVVFWWWSQGYSRACVVWVEIEEAVGLSANKVV